MLHKMESVFDLADVIEENSCGICYEHNSISFCCAFCRNYDICKKCAAKYFSSETKCPHCRQDFGIKTPIRKVGTRTSFLEQARMMSSLTITTLDDQTRARFTAIYRPRRFRYVMQPE